jgi:hypothetical protein
MSCSGGSEVEGAREVGAAAIECVAARVAPMGDNAGPGYFFYALWSSSASIHFSPLHTKSGDWRKEGRHQCNKVFQMKEEKVRHVNPPPLTFLFFGPFCERISQMCPSWKDFKKWTLSSAPWTAAPRLDATAPRITAPRWEAALPSCHDVAVDVAPRVGALICGAYPRRPDLWRRGAFIARPLPSRTFLGFSLPPVPPLLRLHISIPKI